MKKLLFGSILAMSLAFSAQELSCANIVNMSNNQIQKEIKDFQDKLNLNQFNTELSDTNKEYMKQSALETMQLKKCLYLRKSLQYSMEDDRRYKALLDLKNFRLSAEERLLYNQSIQRNINYFSPYSDASLVGDYCKYPLIYLTAQKSSRGVIVYEHRLINSSIRPLNIVMSGKSVKFVCGDSAKANYLNYINKSHVKLKEATPPPPVVTKSEKEAIMPEDTYVTKILLYAKDYNSGKGGVSISKGSIVKIIKYQDYPNGQTPDAIFIYRDKKCIINLTKWLDAIGKRS